MGSSRGMDQGNDIFELGVSKLGNLLDQQKRIYSTRQEAYVVPNARSNYYF